MVTIINAVKYVENYTYKRILFTDRKHRCKQIFKLLFLTKHCMAVVHCNDNLSCLSTSKWEQTRLFEVKELSVKLQQTF